MPLVGIASAATQLNYDFESSSSGDQFSGNGVSGWSQDIANPSAFGQTFPLAYVSATNFGGGSSNSAHLGTQVANTPNNASTTLTGDLTSLTAGGQANAGHIYNMVNASFNLAVLDDSSDSFAGRDGFSVALTTASGAEAATIGLSPTSGNNDSWDVSVGVNGSTSATGATITANSAYKFYIESLDGSTTFKFEAADGTGNTWINTIDSGVVSPFTNTLNQVTGIAFSHDPLGDAGSSANTLAFDEISVQIPEPSSTLLMVLSAGLIVIRKRR
ncbi:PEP-CTERM sorting domain-containing protein [bacterium]|nr:PEP-CTERM sorting domain-containing protein [bacterium]